MKPSLLSQLLAGAGVGLCACFWRRWLQREVFLTYVGPGRWALVTGGSDGIGRELATCFARYGFNIVLVGRSQSKLAATAGELEVLCPHSRFLTISIDVGHEPKAAAAHIYRFLTEQGINLAVLVNNAAVMGNVHCTLEESTEEAIQQQISTNATFPALLTRRLIPMLKLAARTSDRRSLIVNVGSICGLAPMALLATYSGTKAFLKQLSRSIAPELEEHRVDVICVLPGQVCTKMSRVESPSWDVPSAAVFAEAVMAQLRPSARVAIPYWAHSFFAFLMAIGPERTLGRAILADSKKARAKILRQQGAPSQ